jgi:AraC family transcriptional regulator
MDARSRLLRGIDFIEAHLADRVALGDAAAAAELSPYYFSRLFRALTGEPFAAYLRRRRLTVAAERLAGEGAEVPKLVELAFDSGYDSQEAFTRAFKRCFGLTPGAYRERPTAGSLRRRQRIDRSELDHLAEVVSREPVIRDVEPFIVAGVRERFDDESKHQIPSLWQRFLAVVGDIPNVVPGWGYGLCLNPNLLDGSFDYAAAVEVARVDRLPAGVVAETIPRQTYAVFTHHFRSTSHHEELQPTIRWIWGTWLPASSYESVPAPDFERYPPGFDPTVRDVSIEIFVPVRGRA